MEGATTTFSFECFSTRSLAAIADTHSAHFSSITRARMRSAHLPAALFSSTRMCPSVPAPPAPPSSALLRSPFLTVTLSLNYTSNVGTYLPPAITCLASSAVFSHYLLLPHPPRLTPSPARPCTTRAHTHTHDCHTIEHAPMHHSNAIL